MNCNYLAFLWVVEVIKIHTGYQADLKNNELDYSTLSPAERKSLIDEKFILINNDNCLNKLVTSHFLKVKWLYDRIWNYFFADNFANIINSCLISLTNLSPAIL